MYYPLRRGIHSRAPVSRLADGLGQCTALTFINALINSCDFLEDRVDTRTQFMAYGLADAIPTLRTWYTIGFSLIVFAVVYVCMRACMYV
jgi:hypothetical protein